MLTIYAIAFAIILLLGVLANSSLTEGDVLWPPSHVLSWSLAAAWFMACSPAMLLDAREVNTLPISRRELWIVRWWLAVVAPSALLGLATSVASLAGSPAAGPDHTALVLIFCAGYGGCYMALTAAFPLAGAFRPGAWGVARLMIRLVVIPLGGAALPLWFAKYLPLQVSDINGPALSTTIAAIGVTIASYFHHPAITEHLTRRINPSKPSAPARPFAHGRLSGMPFLLWKEVRRSLLVYFAMLLVGIAYWRVFETRTLVEFFNASGALIFAGLPRGVNIGFPVIVMLLGAGTSDIGQGGEMRYLRALPMSARRLAAILVAGDVVATATLWIVLLIAHVIVVGTAPQSLRPELFVLVAGLLSIATIARLLVSGDPMMKGFSGGVVMTPALFLFHTSAQFDAAVKAGIFAGGSVVLIVSWLVITRTLCVSRRVYKFRALAAPTSS